MELTQALEGKRVRIVDIDDKVFEGTVTDYFLKTTSQKVSLG